MAGQLYVISGPSGVGKSTIIHLLMKDLPGLGYSISHTSRRPRDKEVDGVDYHFVDRETFKKMIQKGDFVEWAEVYHDWYGTSFLSLRSQVEKGVDVMMDVDIQGAKNIRSHFEQSVLIYVMPPSLELLEKRLRDRATDDEAAIRTRFEKALREMKACLSYDYIVINKDLPEAVENLKSIVISDRCRTSRQMSRVKQMINVL
jgi:guanylate kinase